MRSMIITKAFVAATIVTSLMVGCGEFGKENQHATIDRDGAVATVKRPQSTPADEEAKAPVGSSHAPPRERTEAVSREIQVFQYRASAPASADAVSAPRFEAYRHMPALPSPPPLAVDRERYAHFDDNPLKRTAEQPVSTFSIDVDTGAYANVRRMLTEGRLPPADAVRVEELINYFAYEDPLPKDPGEPFLATTEVGPSPWNPATKLLRIGIRAWELPAEDLPPANLVFLVDVSGSMQSPDKLPLLKQSLRLLAKRLDHEDRLSLVVYAGASGVVLEPTAGDQQAKIFAAIDGLEAGGSTNGGAGITLAYAQARQAFIESGINRLILATDGDFNVGTVNHEALVNIVERERVSGVSLTTLGFGSGNYNDQLMEQLADHGNGNHAYIDSLLEAQKVLVDEMGATLHTVAKDVKIQIEFNPAVVSEYRLVGYENRMLAREDFNNDQVDAGEIGAGHSIVALYEIALQGESGERVDPLRYGSEQAMASETRDEIGFLRLRFKRPEHERSELREYPIRVADVKPEIGQTSDDFRFAAAVAAFGQRLRGGKYLEGYGYAQIEQLAQGARGQDPNGTRSDLQRLVRLAASLDRQSAQTAGSAAPELTVIR
jgi:Ca-activated chloride channel family protein